MANKNKVGSILFQLLYCKSDSHECIVVFSGRYPSYKDAVDDLKKHCNSYKAGYYYRVVRCYDLCLKR